MKKVLVIAAALALCGGSAMASDLNVSIQSDGAGDVCVPAGTTVNYEVIGELGDADNEGLALITFDLMFDGDVLAQADLPTQDPMLNFTLNAGITNPITVSNPNGYGGSMMNGGLVQIGGAQNTINNYVDNAPFPLGAVITNVAQPGSPVVLASGSLTAPAADGTYNLVLSNLLANVIIAGEDGDPFWAVEEAGAGTNAGLVITVGGCGDLTPLSSVPPNDAADARQPSDPDGSNPAGWNSIAITFDGDASGVVAGDFTITTDPAGSAPGIAGVTSDGDVATIEFDMTIPELAWTIITHDASAVSFRIGYLPADVNGDGTSAAFDVLALVNHLNGIESYPEYQTDIDRSGATNASDILRVIDLLNGAQEYVPYLNATLPD